MAFQTDLFCIFVDYCFEIRIIPWLAARVREHLRKAHVLFAAAHFIAYRIGLILSIIFYCIYLAPHWPFASVRREFFTY